VASGPQLAHLTPTSAVVAWRTTEERAARIEHGPAAGALAILEQPAALEHVFVLDGLQPGATYRWRGYAGGVPLGEEHLFTTPSDAPDAPVRFTAMGDTGTGLPQALAVFAGVSAADPDLALLCGDCAYSSGTSREVRTRFVEPLAGLMAETPLYAVLGNHDVATLGGQPLLDAVFLPVDPAAGTERYYTFTRGNCRFVGLDSNLPLGAAFPQGAWLAATLAANESEWTFLFLHHTTYSSSNHGSSATLQSALVPLCDAYGVDLVLCGHDHDYERTFPLRDGAVVSAVQEPDYVDPGGTVFVVTGGGTNLYAAGTSFFTAYSEAIAHYVVVDVEGPALTLRAIDLDGVVFDAMTITKSRP